MNKTIKELNAKRVELRAGADLLEVDDGPQAVRLQRPWWAPLLAQGHSNKQVSLHLSRRTKITAKNQTRPEIKLAKSVYL